MKKKLLSMIIAAGLAIASFSGCGAKEGSNEGAEKKELEVTIAVSAELASMDSNLITSGESMVVCNQTMEGLYTYNENGELVLGMAKSVDISEDGMTYTFTIRDDAKWSNGKPVTAHDFEYGFKRLANPETGATYAFMLMTAGITNAKSVRYEGGDIDSQGVSAVNDNTLVIKLDRPVAYFPSLMTGTYFLPINQEFCEAQGDQYGLNKDNIIANGPYILKQWVPGDMTYVLEKNPYYYDSDKITVNRITYQVITDNQQAVMAWKQGNIDQIAISGDLAVMYSQDPAFDSIKSAMLWYVAANNETFGLGNANMRMALALSFNKEMICDNILKNGSIPANFAIPEFFAVDANNKTFREAANRTYLEYNKELALDYYNKACEELGAKEYTFNLLFDDAEVTKSIAEYLQSEIQNTLPGVTITLSVMSKNQRVEQMSSHQFDLGLTRWAADYQDATTYLDMWTTDNAYNYGSWSNEEYDSLMALVNGEYANQLDKRLETMIKAEEVIMSEAGIIPVYQASSVYLTNVNLSVPKTPTGMYLWKYATVKSK